MPSLDLSAAAVIADALLSQGEASGLAERVIAAPGRARLLAQLPAYQRPEVVVAVLGQLPGLRHGHAGRLLRLARAAAELARAVRPELMAAELEAQALAEQANALRILGRLRRAELAAGRALDRAAEGSGDPLLAAWCWCVAGTVAGERGRLAPALEALERAGRLYLEMGERHEAGKVAASRARVLAAGGELEAAQRATVEALGLLDPERAPHAAAWTLHNLATYLAEGGRPAAARALLGRLRRLYRWMGTPAARARRWWLEAKICEAEGLPQRALVRLATAERILEPVRPVDAALVAVERAVLLAAVGKLAEAEAAGQVLRWASIRAAAKRVRRGVAAVAA